MRLIIEYQIGDDCTWWATETQPCIYESKQKLLQDIENWVASYLVSNDSTFTEHSKDFGGMTLWISDIVKSGHYEEPTIYTIDEYFEHVEKL